MSNGDLLAIHSFFNLTLNERHIDGNDYMWAVSEMIDSAKEFIFILVTHAQAVLRIICLLELDLTSGLVAYS
jgi:phosphatidylserine/phosphatidylglycerophosphate/cardiolipin synthase-like enzyme